MLSTSPTVLSTSPGVPGTSWDPVAFSDLEVSSLKSVFLGMPVRHRPPLEQESAFCSNGHHYMRTAHMAEAISGKNSFAL